MPSPVTPIRDRAQAGNFGQVLYGAIPEVHATLGMMDNSRPDADELRKRGLELQAAIPRPSRRIPKWLDPTCEPSAGKQVAGATAYELAIDGLWGLLFVAPVAVVWLVRRLRDR